ncbi:MAG: hypothetical protein JNM24_17420 [Bdellovibrionaceae bacterium]|nr:hypothetical protein [Pseudobdellovibrionaceae bacterium]
MKIKIVLVVLFALSTVFAGGSQGGGVGAASVRTESVKSDSSKENRESSAASIKEVRQKSK